MWVNSLRKAAEVEREIRRTVNGVIKYNAHLLYKHYEEKHDGDIIKMTSMITDGVRLNLKMQEFNEALKTTSREISYFYDAFYAHKPFSSSLLRFVSIQIHKPLRERIYTIWNKNKKSMNAGDIIAFMNAVSYYERTLKTWGVEDSRFSGWIDPLLKTFIEKLYERCRLVLATILYDQRNKYYLENKRIVSRSSESLEAHLNFILDHYSQVPTLDAAKLLLGTCSNIIILFLMNTRNFIREDKFPLQVYIALQNNAYLKIIKNFQKRVISLTKNQISLKEVKAKLDEEYLLVMIAEIEKLCYDKISLYISRKVVTEFSTNTNYMTLALSSHLDHLIKDCTKILEYIESRFAVNDLFFDIFDNVTNVYYKRFLDNAPKVTAKTLDDLKSKIKGDMEIFENILEANVVEKKQEIIFKMNQLYTFVDTEDLDLALISLINMNVLYPGIIDYANIDKLLRLKTYFTKNWKDYISNYLKKSLEEFKVRSSKKDLWKVFVINPQITIFIRNLSEFKRKSCPG